MLGQRHDELRAADFADLIVHLGGGDALGCRLRQQVADVLQHLGEMLGVHIGVHALVLIGNHDVHAVRMVADPLVDPVEFDLELLRRVADGAEDSVPTRLAHRDHDVAAVGEREDRELDAELVAKGSVHSGLLERCGPTETCSSFLP